MNNVEHVFVVIRIHQDWEMHKGVTRKWYIEKSNHTTYIKQITVHRKKTSNNFGADQYQNNKEENKRQTSTLTSSPKTWIRLVLPYLTQQNF